MAYINCHRGTRSAAVLRRVCYLLLLRQFLRITLQAAHLVGQQKVLADVFSRGNYDSGAWTRVHWFSSHLFALYG